MSVCQQSVFQRYHSGKHFPESYPQDGGESQLVSKLRQCHSMYNINVKQMFLLAFISFLFSSSDPLK